MQISLANAKKLNWLWQDENEIAWIETFLKAVDKRGKETACSMVLKALDSYQANYYMNLHNYSRYVAGQVDKRVQNIPLDQCKEYNLVLPLEPEMNNESQ